VSVTGGSSNPVHTSTTSATTSATTSVTSGVTSGGAVGTSDVDHVCHVMEHGNRIWDLYLEERRLRIETERKVDLGCFNADLMLI
jgi:hypothetical protein